MDFSIGRRNSSLRGSQRVSVQLIDDDEGNNNSNSSSNSNSNSNKNNEDDAMEEEGGKRPDPTSGRRGSYSLPKNVIVNAILKPRTTISAPPQSEETFYYEWKILSELGHGFSAAGFHVDYDKEDEEEVLEEHADSFFALTFVYSNDLIRSVSHATIVDTPENKKKSHDTAWKLLGISLAINMLQACAIIVLMTHVSVALWGAAGVLYNDQFEMLSSDISCGLITASSSYCAERHFEYGFTRGGICTFMQPPLPNGDANLHEPLSTTYPHVTLDTPGNACMSCDYAISTFYEKEHLTEAVMLPENWFEVCSTKVYGPFKEWRHLDVVIVPIVFAIITAATSRSLRTVYLCDYVSRRFHTSTDYTVHHNNVEELRKVRLLLLPLQLLRWLQVYWLSPFCLITAIMVLTISEDTVAIIEHTVAAVFVLEMDRIIMKLIFVSNGVGSRIEEKLLVLMSRRAALYHSAKCHQDFILNLLWLLIAAIVAYYQRDTNVVNRIYWLPYMIVARSDVLLKRQRKVHVPRSWSFLRAYMPCILPMVLYSAAYDGSSAFPKSQWLSTPLSLIWGQSISQTGINFYAGAVIGMAIAIWEDPRGILVTLKPWMPCLRYCRKFFGRSNDHSNSQKSSAIYAAAPTPAEQNNTAAPLSQQPQSQQPQQNQQSQDHHEVDEFLHEGPVTLCLFAICFLNLYIMWNPGINGTSADSTNELFDYNLVATIFGIQIALTFFCAVVIFWHIRSMISPSLNNYGPISTISLYIAINIAYYIYVLVTCTHY